MKASFLISAPAYSRLAPAASERGWRSDPDYARRTVDRLLRSSGPRHELDGRPLADLAAMSGEFGAAAPLRGRPRDRAVLRRVPAARRDGGR